MSYSCYESYLLYYYALDLTEIMKQRGRIPRKTLRYRTIRQKQEQGDECEYIENIVQHALRIAIQRYSNDPNYTASQM